MPLLPDIPFPPQGLIDAAESGKLVLFVGAGVSRICGSPGWEGVASALLKRLIFKNLINHSVRMQLATLPLKTRISIALSIAEKHEAKPTTQDYRNILMTRNLDEKTIGHELYRDLTSLSKHYVTTNYDEWLEFTYPETLLGDAEPSVITPLGQRQLACIPSDLTITNMADGKVIHLHGSLTLPASMILTTAEYLNHYRNDRGTDLNPVTDFLYRLFQKGGWTVLFVGYGMEEMEVLEYVLQKSHVFDDTPHQLECRHYLLRGFYSHEGPLIAHLRDYYKKHCGVSLVPFSLDRGDHSQLGLVISDWAKRIRAKPLPPLEKRLELEKLLDD